jgi:hypothetical protein
MRRSRNYLISATAITGIVIAMIMIARDLPSRDRRDITLLYVGAEDCAPCRKWQREDGALFQAAAEFRRITYREVKSPALFDLLKDEHWPVDLRLFRERLSPGMGVPLWLIVADGEIVEQQSGASRWQAAVLPRIRSLLRWQFAS